MTLKELENCFNAAKEKGAKYVAVIISLKDTNKSEIIINPRENFVLKLDYYKQAYTNNLEFKKIPEIKILGFTYGNTFSDIEKDLASKQ